MHRPVSVLFALVVGFLAMLVASAPDVAAPATERTGLAVAMPSPLARAPLAPSPLARAPLAGLRRHGTRTSPERPRRDSQPAIATVSSDTSHVLLTLLAVLVTGASSDATLAAERWIAPAAREPGRLTPESFRRPLRC